MIENMEDIDVDPNEHAELTAAIKSNKKCQSTKTQYKRKLIRFEEWVQIKRPGLNRQGVWLCNVDKNTIYEDFMGHICQKKTEGGEYFAPRNFSLIITDLPPHFDLSEGVVLTVSRWEEIHRITLQFIPRALRLS